MNSVCYKEVVLKHIVVRTLAFYDEPCIQTLCWVTLDAKVGNEKIVILQAIEFWGSIFEGPTVEKFFHLEHVGLKFQFNTMKGFLAIQLMFESIKVRIEVEWTHAIIGERNKVIMETFDDGFGAFDIYFTGRLSTGIIFYYNFEFGKDLKGMKLVVRATVDLKPKGIVASVLLGHKKFGNEFIAFIVDLNYLKVFSVLLKCSC